MSAFFVTHIAVYLYAMSVSITQSTTDHVSHLGHLFLVVIFSQTESYIKLSNRVIQRANSPIYLTFRKFRFTLCKMKIKVSENYNQLAQKQSYDHQYSPDNLRIFKLQSVIACSLCVLGFCQVFIIFLLLLPVPSLRRIRRIEE